MILEYGGHRPQLGEDVFVAPQAVLIGQVELGAQSSVWFHAVLRADNDCIRVGPRSNLQENVVCHVDSGLPMHIGADCVIGHAAVLHGCWLGDRVLVGIGAKVLNGARVENDVVIGAGSLVPERARLESGCLYLGSPARRVRELRPEEFERIRKAAHTYVEKGRQYRDLLQGASS
jgi:carbonic anhydrase/acetyltransferase-like protein (isoleucine patch superfamily)